MGLPADSPITAGAGYSRRLVAEARSWLRARAKTSVTTRSTTMPDAMMNGGFAPYLAQAFTPQGVAGGLFGSGIGNVPGNMFSNPAFAQSYTPGGVPGGVPPFTVTPQLGQPYAQAYPGWQQQLPQFTP